MDKSLEVTLSYSDSGCPLFLPETGAKLIVEVQEGGIGPVGETLSRHVGIVGNKQGLIALATALLSLAESTDPQHHLHIDDLYESVVESPQGFWLTIIKLTTPET